MDTKKCIFCAIIDQVIPAQILYKNEYVVVIKDAYPKAPIHYLIIPKKHISDLREVTQDDTSMLASLMFVAQHLSLTMLDGIDFKIVGNNGSKAGQSVFHMHVHFLAGDHLGEL